MITATGLTKHFDSFQALKGINLNIDSGEVYGFLGHNGAGKSTTINILAGFSKATAGACIVNGWSLDKVEHPGDLHICYLPEEPKFYSWMTGREILLYLACQMEQPAATNRIRHLLDWADLGSASERRVGGYSRGMKQRLGMAAALLYDPDLLILDEPSSALDPEGRSQVLRLILDLKQQGKTVFFSTHILSDVERVCDRVGILSDGRMVLEKPLRQLLRENVDSMYEISFTGPCPEDLMARLRHIPGVNDVNNNEAYLTIAVDEPGPTGNAILALLSSSSLTIDSFGTRKASLEEIFIKEVGKHAV